MKSDFAESVRKEVLELHHFFERWFNGIPPKSEEAFARVTSVWFEPFSLIDPRNKIHDAASLLTETFNFHGAFPHLKIGIHDLSVRAAVDSNVAIACYEEWHIDTLEKEIRTCSATLVRHAPGPLGVKWLHINESSCSQPNNAI